MKRITLAILAALAITAAAPLPAQAVEQGFTTPRYFGPKLDGVALNATAALRTITVNLTHNGTATGNAAYSKILLGVAHTFSTATTITVLWTCSLDGTNYMTKTSRAIAAGAGTVSLFLDTYPTGSASTSPLFELDVRGCKAVKMLLGGASAGVGDLVDAYVTAIVGK